VTSTFLPLTPGMPSVRVLLGAVAIRVSWSGDAAQSLMALRRYAPLRPRIFRIWTITRSTSGFNGALIRNVPADSDGAGAYATSDLHAGRVLRRATPA
jgi:hypothetical protein